MSWADGPILVTGASGFIGRRVMAELAIRGLPASVLARPFGDLDVLSERLGDLRPRAIIHLAGLQRADHRGTLEAANIGLAAAILAAAERLSQRPAVVLAGSAAEYGPAPHNRLLLTEQRPCRPVDPYGETKLAQTRLGLAASARGVPAVCARIFNVIGPGMTVHQPIGRFAAEIDDFGPEGGILDTGPLDIVRDYLPVTDAAEALVGLSLTPAAAGLIVNVCTGRSTSLRRLTEGLVERSGKPVRLRTAGSPRPGFARIIGSPARLKALGLGLPMRSTVDLIASMTPGAS